ncbi:5314_t:CDS:2, partial [Scutellospora calospora]
QLTISGLDPIANDSNAFSYITDVQDDQGKVYIYGVIDSSNSTNNLYILDLFKLTLSFGARVNAPPIDSNYSCVLINNKTIFYFGGFNISEQYIKSPMTTNSSGDQPTNRYASSSVLDSSGHVIVYGDTLGTNPITVTDKLAILDTNQILYK